MPHSTESSAQHSSWAELPVEQLNQLLTRQFVHGTQSMFARLELKKGCHVPRHSHPNEQISYISEGALRFLLGPEDALEERIVRAGDVLVIPGGLPHSADALEDTVDFDVFAPHARIGYSATIVTFANAGSDSCVALPACSSRSGYCFRARSMDDPHGFL